MAITRIPWDTPHYLMESAELASGSVISGSMVTIGGLVFISDLQKWKIIESDMSLSDFVWNTDGVGGSSGSYVATSGSSKYSTNSASSVYATTSVSAVTSTSATRVVQEAIFAVDGDLIIVSNPLRLYNVTGNTRIVSNVFCAVAVPCSGSQSIIVDVHNSGSSIFTSASTRPQINTGSYTGSSSSITLTSWLNNQFLTMDIDQVGSGSSGSALTVHVIFS